MLKETLLSLLRVPGPSGAEEACAKRIEEMVAPYVDNCYTDVMGNLICIKKGAGKRVMLAAHMDQIGFIVTAVEENGFLRVANIGGINAKVSFASHVTLKSGAPGVLFKESDNEQDQLFIDVGAQTREQAQALADVGDWAVIAGVVTDMGERVAAPYMDNRAGCAMLVETLSRVHSDAEIVAVFTVQEEVGCRGAQTAGYALEPDLAIALDVTIAGDVPRLRNHNSYVVSSLGKGAAIKVMDRGIIAHKMVREGLVQAAQRCGAKYQMEVLTAGATDAASIHLTRGGVPSGTLSIPCRYVHAPCETVDLRDMESGVCILCEMLAHV